MFAAAIVRDGITAFTQRADGVFADVRLAVAARDIEDVGGLAEAGNAAAQFASVCVP